MIDNKIDTIIKTIEDDKLSFSLLNDGSYNWQSGILKRNNTEYYHDVMGIGLIFNKSNTKMIIDALYDIIKDLGEY